MLLPADRSQSLALQKKASIPIKSLLNNRGTHRYSDLQHVIHSPHGLRISRQAIPIFVDRIRHHNTGSNLDRAFRLPPNCRSKLDAEIQRYAVETVIGERHQHASLDMGFMNMEFEHQNNYVRHCGVCRADFWTRCEQVRNIEYRFKQIGVHQRIFYLYARSVVKPDLAGSQQLYINVITR